MHRSSATFVEREKRFAVLSPDLVCRERLAASRETRSERCCCLFARRVCLERSQQILERVVVLRRVSICGFHVSDRGRRGRAAFRCPARKRAAELERDRSRRVESSRFLESFV